MKFLLVASSLALAITASPIVATGFGYETSEVVPIEELVARGTTELYPRKSEADANLTANGFLDSTGTGGCKDVMLVYARGSTQDGNMGDQPGPQLATALQTSLGAVRVSVQGVDYPAGLAQNLLPGGTSSDSATEMAALLGNISSTCAGSKIVVSGYSQGAALVHRAMEKITNQTVLNQVAAAVTFGDTQKKQDDDGVPNVSANKTLILCNDGDLVCNGTLIVTPKHLDYTGKVQQASDFVTGLIQ